jgi:hypothetical protein
MSWAKPTTVSLLSRAERRIDGVLTARRETRPVGYDPIDSMLERTYYDHLVRYWLRCLSFRYWVREAAENIGAGKPPS